MKSLNNITRTSKLLNVNKLFSLIAMLSIMLFASACEKKSTHTDIMVVKPWISEIIPGSTVTAGYMQIMNHTDKDDVLTGVKADISKFVEIHEMSQVDGVMRMRRLDSVPVAQGKSVEFKTGGMHIMFIETTKELKIGEKVPVTLVFQNRGDLAVELEVKSIKSIHEH